MKLSGKQRCWIAWAACLAMLLNALAPAVSHAMASAGGSTSIFQEVCSAAGNRVVLTVELDSQKPTKGKDSQSKPMQHCPFCSTHAGSFGLATDFSPALIVPAVSYALPELFYRSPRPLFVWAASSPRAPPTLS